LATFGVLVADRRVGFDESTSRQYRVNPRIAASMTRALAGDVAAFSATS